MESVLPGCTDVPGSSLRVCGCDCQPLRLSPLSLQKTLKIQEVGLMPMGGAMPAAAPAAAAPEVSQALASTETCRSGAQFPASLAS